MNRVEFLEKLRQALEQNVSAQAVRENVEYYNQYISDELRKGRSEQDIMGELGDPWVIARTIIDSEEAKNLSNESNLKDETELGSVDKIYRTDTPKTGDDSNIFLWTSLFLSSIILINEVYVYSNKKKYRI